MCIYFDWFDLRRHIKGYKKCGGEQVNRLSNRRIEDKNWRARLEAGKGAEKAGCKKVLFLQNDHG